MSTLALIRARAQYPWLSPILAALTWAENVPDAPAEGSYAKGVVSVPETLTPELAIHHALKVGLRHPQRGKGRGPKRWAQASRQACNTLVPVASRVGEWDAYLGDGKSADEYYNLLPEDEEDEPEDEQGDGEPGDEEAPGLTQARGKMMSHESCPEQVKEAARVVHAQPVRWQDLLKGAVVSVPVRGAKRRCYSRMHRLQACIGGGIVMGKLVADRPNCSIVVDTSGSMWDVLDTIKVEVARVVKAVGYDCDIIQCDTEVRGRGAGVRAMNQWRGGGGTTIGPGIRAAEESGAKVIVIITDGYIEGGIEKPKVPVIWCMTTDVKPYPWGTYVKAEV